MTTRRRAFADAFTAPEAQTYAIGRTVRAGAGELLSKAANDACYGYLAQRWSLPAVQGGVWNWFYAPSDPARFLRLNAIITRIGGGITFPTDVVTFALEITDGTNTVTGTDARIPEAFRNASVDHRAGLPTGRWATANRVEAFVDLDALASGSPGLDRSVPWRVTLTIVCGVTLEVSSFSADELPRWWIDDGAAAYGTLPGLILPRSEIIDAPETTRILATLDAANANPRTYLSISRDEGGSNFLSVTSLTAHSFATWEESSGVSISHAVRVHAPGVLSSSGGRWRAQCRYKVTGGSGGDTSSVQVITGTGTQGITLTDTSGTWVDSDVWTGHLATNLTDRIDTIQLKGLVSKPGMTLRLDALNVWAYPD